jgi:hypothetical protein
VQVLADLPGANRGRWITGTSAVGDLVGTRPVQATAATPTDFHLGQSGRAPQLVDRKVALRSRGDAALRTLIEQTYTEGERMGLAVWGMDNAGPYQAIP